MTTISRIGLSRLLHIGLVSVLASPVPAMSSNYSELVYPNHNGELIYEPINSEGDVIPDFSHAGYKGGGVRIPDVPTVEVLAPSDDGSDDTNRLQEAIDQIAQREPDEDGFRGALVLESGIYRIEGRLTIEHSGIVIRGQGPSGEGTVLLGVGEQPRSIIRINSPHGKERDDQTRQSIVDAYVPLGANSFQVEDASLLEVGDTVHVVRKGNAAWISHLEMDNIRPRPADPSGTRNWGPFDISFDRVITQVDGNTITLDAPIGMAIDEQWGGGEIYRFNDRRLQKVGVENLRVQSDPAHGEDENHAGNGISTSGLVNGWVRDVTFVAMSGSAVSLGGDSKWITVEDCQYLDPASEIRGGRRGAFVVSNAQLVLFQRCYTDHARHSFHVGSRVPGPNAFVNCWATNVHGKSGPHQRWSVSTLWDNVQGGPYRAEDRQWYGTGHGWAGANSLFWNGRGGLYLEQPPTAHNFAIGFVGQKLNPSHSFTNHEPGYIESFGQHVYPQYLYYTQLKQRRGPEAVEAVVNPNPAY